MKIAILCNSRTFPTYGNKIKLELEKNGAEVDLLFSDDLDLHNSLDFSYDLIYSRLSGLKWTYEILHQISMSGVKLIPNLSYFINSQNKYLACVLAEKNGVKVPKTHLIATHPQYFKENLKTSQNFSYPLIIKPLYSSLCGDLCYKISDANDLKQKIQEIYNCHKKGIDPIGTYDYALMQGFVNYQKIIRSLVIEGKTITSGYTTPLNGWKCSICQNPNIIKFDVNEKLNIFHEAIFHTFKGEIMIVDVFETKNGFILNECNTACGLFNLESLYKRNFAKIIANYLLDEVQR